MRRSTTLFLSTLLVSPFLLGDAHGHGGAYNPKVNVIPSGPVIPGGPLTGPTVLIPPTTPGDRGPGTPPGGGGGPSTPPGGGGGPSTPPGGGGGPSTPPGGGGCGPSTPPGGGGGPSTPPGGGGAGPKSPSSPPSTPRQPGAGPVPGAGPKGPITRGGSLGKGGAGGFGKKNKGAISSDRWDVWWQHNQGPYLLSRMGGQHAVTGKASFLGAEGKTRGTVDALDSKGMSALVTPVLLRALSSSDFEVVDSALLALGRANSSDVSSDGTALVVENLKRALGSTFPSVRQSAVLALGITGNRAASPILWEIMNDTRTARGFFRTEGSVPTVERSFAALSLALSTNAGMTPQLMKLVRRLKTDDTEVVAGAVLSLGMARGEEAQVVPFLAELLTERKMDRRIRAQVPVALSRLGESAASTVPTLLKMVNDRRMDRSLRHSCAIALGSLTAAGDEEVSRALLRLIRKDSDAQLRHFAIIALGRMGHSALQGSNRSKEGADRIASALMSEMVDPSHGVDLGWVALSCGILGDAYPEGSEMRGKISKLLIDRFESTGNPTESGALAVALGIAGSKAAGPILKRRFDLTSDNVLRGHLAVAMGLIGQLDSADDLADYLGDTNDPALRVNLATGLALLGSDSGTEMLLQVLEDNPDFASAASAGQALGRIADPASLGRLLRLAESENGNPFARAFSCVALGLIVESGDLPWNAPLSIDSNYAADLTAQTEVLDIF